MYDTNAAGESAPHTDYVSRRDVRRLFARLRRAWRSTRATSTPCPTSRVSDCSGTSTGCSAWTSTSPRASSTARSRMPRRSVDGVLLPVYHRPIAGWFKDASTVMEHVESFRRSLPLRAMGVNTDTGFPPGLRDLDFSAVRPPLLALRDGAATRSTRRWLELPRSRRAPTRSPSSRTSAPAAGAASSSSTSTPSTACTPASSRPSSARSTAATPSVPRAGVQHARAT